MSAAGFENLEAQALRVREHVIRMATNGGCFLGASLSCTDLLVYLYDRVLRVSPGRLDDPERDYLLLSKGHDVPALYGLLAERGYFPVRRLRQHLAIDDHLYWHPNRAVPGVEFHSGSLGHGLAVGMGIALDVKLRRGSSRVFVVVGICEQTMVGMAAGLALRGRIPVVHALATFLTLRAFEFVRTDVGIAGLPVKLVGGVPGFLSEANGPTHQAIDDVAVMRAIPGMQIFCPADESELCAGLPEVLASPAPAYIRFNARPSTLAHAPFALGRAEVVTNGSDVGVIAAGLLVPNAAQACVALRAEGIRARLLNLRMLAPIDEAAVVEAARACRVLVTVEDHLLTGGLYALVTEILVRHRVSAPVVPLGLDGRWFRPGRLADVLAHEGFTADALAARFKRAWEEEAGGARAATGDRAMPNHVAPNLEYPSIANSDAVYARAIGLIPGATQTLAKGAGQHVRGVAPKFLRAGVGARVFDVDDNEYLDMTMAVGPLVLGYRDRSVDDAIRAQLDAGITFSLPHPLEVEVAELIQEVVPGAERIRFGKNGCDVTTAAVRLARAFTGRDKVLCCGYHGWHDWYIAVTDRSRGVPGAVAALTHTFAYNDLASAEARSLLSLIHI